MVSRVPRSRAASLDLVSLGTDHTHSRCLGAEIACDFLHAVSPIVLVTSLPRLKWSLFEANVPFDKMQCCCMGTFLSRTKMSDMIPKSSLRI